MKKKLFLYFIILHLSSLLIAQEKPCIQYERPKFATGPHPKTSPVFPGCEHFKESNDSLNKCFGFQMSSRIADKFDLKILPNAKLDSSYSIVFRTKVILDIDQSGNLKMKLKERDYTDFEIRLVTKLKELEEEITGIRPAEYEGGYCSRFRYQLPLLFTEEK